MNAYRLYTRKLHFFERITHATYPQLFLLWIGLNIIFTVFYFTLNITSPEHGPTLPPDLSIGERLFDSLYFSVVTATSTGYGDILPQGFSKVLAMVQCIMALLVFAVLVGKLVSQRQDTTLHEVHRMTFEGIFYHIRHILFIVRKDFDGVIHKVESGVELAHHDWENLATGYLQAHSLIAEIPDLYNGHGYDLHNVDLNREKLLFEALHRTLQRVNTLLITFEKHRVDWAKQEASAKEMRRLIDTVEGIMPLWKEGSPFHEVLEFEDVRQLTVKLREHMKKSMQQHTA